MRVARGPVPVPVKLTVCGLYDALSVKVSVAPRLPLVVGEKVTLTVHIPFIASGLTHVLVGIAKSPGLAPFIWMLVIVRAEDPPLVRVTL